VQGAFAEPEVDHAHVARELAEELRLVASWLELDEVVVTRRGNLARELAGQIGGCRGPEPPVGACSRPIQGSLVSRCPRHGSPPGVIHKAILLAFGLVMGAMIFRALTSLILGVLIVVIIATPLAAFADLLQRWRCPRAVGATLGLLIGLGAVAGLVALIVPVFDA
jgi:hypothetical protein